MNFVLRFFKNLFSKGKRTEESGKTSQNQAGKEIGSVTHYFSKSKAAVIKLHSGSLSVGDTILFRGHTTHFKQKVDSLQIDHKSLNEAERGKDVAILVKARVRPHDSVYKL